MASKKELRKENERLRAKIEELNNMIMNQIVPALQRGTEAQITASSLLKHMEDTRLINEAMAARERARNDG